MKKFKLLGKNKINSLPKKTGVYAFKKDRDFLYIGKAANIRQRVKNHFSQPGFKGNLFIQEAEKVGYIKTASEIEALLLEAELIKKYQPKYNVMWKDDKNYLFVAITKEDLPRVFITHQIIHRIIHQKQPKQPVSNRADRHDLKQKQKGYSYFGPFVDGKALKKTFRILRRVFPYRTCRTLPKKACLYYELGLCPIPCGSIRADRQNLKQKGYGVLKGYNENIKNLVRVLQGKKKQVLINLKKEMKESSRKQDFEKAAMIRDQINALENVFENAHILQELPKKEIIGWQKTERVLRKILGVRNKIKRIEGYDVSNIQGLQATGAMVVFERGKPSKKDYRKFKIKISGKVNDIAMLKEILSRRFKHTEWALPQIILIDGGKAQLNAANLTMKQLNNKTIKVIALAKRKNELFMQGKRKPILLKNLPQEVSNLILHIRDEAHRFAIKYHKQLRKEVLTK